MERRLQYFVYANYSAPLYPEDTPTKIILAQHMMNCCFSWTSPGLDLGLFTKPAIKRGIGLPGPWGQSVGFGSTKVDSDEWNAVLVLRFLRWVSIQIPDSTIYVHDDGGYILAGHVLLRNGETSTDATRIEGCRAWLQANGFPDMVRELDEAVSKSARGEFFADVKAGEYAERREIAALGFTKDELDKLTLEDVADRMVFPWHTEWFTSHLD